MPAVFDSWAVLAYLQDEPAANIVERYLETDECLLSAINYTEVLYWLERRVGLAVAAQFRDELLRPDSPLRLIVIGPRLAQAAARVKARGRLSVADAYAAALTLQLGNGTLLTGDPELRTAAELWGYSLEWLGS